MPVEPDRGAEDHLITAAKVVEYALLAPAAVLLFRRRVDLDRFFAVFVGWSARGGLWGLLQFLGVVSEFEGKRPGTARGLLPRHQDFGGVHRRDARDRVRGDRARTSAAALASVAVAAGAIGVILDASIFAYVGVVLAALAAVWSDGASGTLTVRRASRLRASSSSSAPACPCSAAPT